MKPVNADSSALVYEADKSVPTSENVSLMPRVVGDDIP